MITPTLRTARMGATFSASSVSKLSPFSYVPTRVFGDNMNTNWETDTETRGAWLEVTYPEEKTVGEIWLLAKPLPYDIVFDPYTRGGKMQTPRRVTCSLGGGASVNRIRFNSNAGGEYLSIRYGAELAASGIAPSVGTVGDSYDNALAESIIGLYKTEVIDHLGPWETPAQVEAATSEWASWYNTARVMRRTGGRPPGGYEQAWRDGTLGQVPARGPGSRPRRPPEGGGDGRR